SKAGVGAAIGGASNDERKFAERRLILSVRRRGGAEARNFEGSEIGAGIAANERGGQRLPVGKGYADVFFSRNGVIGGNDQVWAPVHTARGKVAAGVNRDNGRTYPLDEAG